MNKTEKEEIVSTYKELINNSSGMFLVDYRGVNVEDINRLRKEFRKEGIQYKVLKNTLFKRALTDIGGYDKISDLLEGMIGTAFAGENFVAPAKIIKKYNKDTGKFVFKGGYIESQFYSEENLDVLASMPTKEEIMASIVGSVAAPASGIVGAINAVMRDLAVLVGEISKQKAA